MGKWLLTNKNHSINFSQHQQRVKSLSEADIFANLIAPVKRLFSELITPKAVIKQQILTLIAARKEVTRNELVLATKKEAKVIDRLLTQMQCEELIEIGNRDSDGAGAERCCKQFVYRIAV